LKKPLAILVLALGLAASPLWPGAPGAALGSLPVSPSGQGVTLLLAGGPGNDELRITLGAGGGSYLISSSTSLEVGGGICSHPEGDPDQLSCEAARVGSFVFNGGAGDDTVVLGRDVSAPATLRGGPGDDTLVGGAGDDVLVGGPGDDTLVGRGGDDRLYGGPGEDRLVGGPGEDTCVGGPGRDTSTSCEITEGIP
jgi:Ca2+-binding RTX toxin-like protein